MTHVKSDLVFYYNPHSRAAGVLPLMEELNVPYEMKLIDFNKGDEYKEEFVKINPMSKVPVIVHKGTVVTEQPAIYTYLADEFSMGQLAPAIGSSARGSYLRWLSFYGSCFEPALMDISLKRETPNRMQTPYADSDVVLKTINDHLAKNNFFAGTNISAADFLWAGGLAWVTMFKLVERTSVIDSYIKRVSDRPSFAAASVKAEKIAKDMGII